MPIRPLLEDERSAFGPDEINAITSAFEQTLRELRLVDRRDPAVAIVARRIIEFAKGGERDPARLASPSCSPSRIDCGLLEARGCRLTSGAVLARSTQAVQAPSDRL